MLGNCCNACIIGEDKFSANDGRPHSGWTNLPAIWDTVSGEEATNVSGIFKFEKPNVQKFNTGHPDGIGAEQHVKVKFRLNERTPGGGAMAEVIVGYNSDSQYLVAQVMYHADNFSTGCDFLTILKRDTGSSNGYYGSPGRGVPLIPIRGLTLNEWHTIDVCLKPNAGSYGYETSDTVRAKVTLADGTVWACEGYADGYVTGAYAGLSNAYLDYGTGPSDNELYGTVEFDDFQFTYFRNDTYPSCPNCNGPCHIFADDFEDYDSGRDNELGCFWSDSAGTGRFDGTYLQCDSGSKIRCDLPHPTNKSSKIVTVTFLWEASRKVKVDLGSGYAIFDSTTGARRISLYDNDSNLLDQSAVDSLPVADDALHTAEVCLISGAITATMDGVCLDAASADTEDPYVYLGSTGGTVKFATFNFKKYKDTTEPKDSGCETCECVQICEACIDDLSPGFIKAAMPNDIDNNLIATCENFRGTHVVPFESLCNYDSPLGTGNYDPTIRFVSPGEPGWDGTQPATYRVWVRITGTDIIFGPFAIFWQKDYGTNILDCMNFLDEEIPFAGATGSALCISSSNLPVYITSL